MQDLLRRFLTRHTRRVVLSTASAEASQMLGELHATDLVVIDVLGDDSGLSLLEEIAAGAAAHRPAVIIVAGKASVEIEARASLLGAIGFVQKPVSLSKLSAVLRSAAGPLEDAAPRMRGRPIAEAVLLDDSLETEIATWDVQDVSATGAFVLTQVAYPPGTTLPLELRMGDVRVRAPVRVVRVQDGDSLATTGIGVRFETSEATLREIESALAFLAPLARQNR